MTESLKLGGVDPAVGPKIRRLNRVPVIIAIALVVVFLAVIFYGLTSRGLRFGDNADGAATGSRSASSYADQLTRGVPDGIIGEPVPTQLQPKPAEATEPSTNPFVPHPEPRPLAGQPASPGLEPEEIWRARLEREQLEQYLREQHRQRMARVQANDAAFDSPIAVSIDDRKTNATDTATIASLAGGGAQTSRPPSAIDLYAAAMQGGLGGQATDPNGQAAKERFFNQDIRELGYLPKSVVPQLSPYELKRGSVIPATLVTGINSDLPGRITAQVSQNVYDSATGRHLLIPQGSKLFGRYDSNVSFGQNRVLAIWTDIIFPNGATLQIGGMAGTDAAGYGGFSDRVDNHYLQTFGSAILVALIGAGTEMMIPQDRDSFGNANSAEDAARRSFAETFGQMSQQTASKNLDVQPTLEIRPGYKFNVLVDQDIQLPGPGL
ncbi:conjugal transfer protein TrbI [Devosia limi DSM 17137]|uniref:Conjugal transfer protein TrbI n=1 Tax=Devosia limi DSM 17137 TaxID=1121477 RepID=A0A0F5LQI6_9HYPH|nr:IncP-type conjugal transfer protein TrbI [Devosia limi]KKB84620.1 conjugal transfer protein TrbI [Devosia limi DSM 17137]ODT77224.1 MAG: conjugal transfer protein TrbI [Pelagibacterium sp. SCN 64-44]SHF56775.1 type IV secretion system protein VirB10 [Devosia limi DSM 17137]